VRGNVCALCQCISSISSFLSVKPAMTLRHFRLLPSSSIFKRPPVPRELADFFWEGPSDAGRFPAAFLVTRGMTSFAPSSLLSVTLCQRCKWVSRASTLAGQSSVGTSKMYTAARSGHGSCKD
jgi:hypothetical protein